MKTTNSDINEIGLATENRQKNLEHAIGPVQLCSFWIGSRLFGIPILDIKEISDGIAITPIFHSTPSVLGYMNIRGQIHLVADVRSYFGLKKDHLESEDLEQVRLRRIILFKSAVEEPFGILVDKMDDVVTVDGEQIQERRNVQISDEEHKASDRRAVSTDLTRGVCKLEKGLLVVLQPKSLVQAVEREVTTKPEGGVYAR